MAAMPMLGGLAMTLVPLPGNAQAGLILMPVIHVLMFGIVRYFVPVALTAKLAALPRKDYSSTRDHPHMA